MKKAHRGDPHGKAEEGKARSRGGLAHHHMLKAGGASMHERKRGGMIPGEKKIETAEHDDEEGRRRGGKVHGEKPAHRLDKRARGGRMTPKSPLSGAGGGTPPFPHPPMPMDEGGAGKVKKRAMGGAMDMPGQAPMGTQFKRGGRAKKRAMGGGMGFGKKMAAEKHEGADRSGGAPPSKRADGGHWISGAIKHPGALHRELGVPEGEKIPAKKIAKAAHSSNPTLAKRARLAQTLKGLHH